MIIADIKRKENIVEYIIYIKQIQDIIRANNFDIDKIEDHIISKYQVPEKVKINIREWYANLIISMKQEKLDVEEDLKFIRDLLDKLNNLNKELLADNDELKHADLYLWAKLNIDEYKKISKSSSENEIEICVNALYSLLLLRLQKKDISMETIEAMQTFSNLLAHLALKFREFDY
jgi:hypothetical protein